MKIRKLRCKHYRHAPDGAVAFIPIGCHGKSRLGILIAIIVGAILLIIAGQTAVAPHLGAKIQHPPPAEVLPGAE